jgi:hypothetical protein
MTGDTWRITISNAAWRYFKLLSWRNFSVVGPKTVASRVRTSAVRGSGEEMEGEERNAEEWPITRVRATDGELGLTGVLALLRLGVVGGNRSDDEEETEVEVTGRACRVIDRK